MNADVPALVQMLEAGSAVEQRAAAEKLARLESDAQGAAAALVAACASADAELRDWSVAALEGLGPPASGDVTKLAELLRHDSVDVAYWAATLLGRLRADDSAAGTAVPALATALENHPELPVRERAAWALGQIGPAAQSARSALEQAAQSGDARLARLAKDALARL